MASTDIEEREQRFPVLHSNPSELRWFGAVDTILPRRQAARSHTGRLVTAMGLDPMPSVRRAVEAAVSGAFGRDRALRRLVAADAALAVAVVRHASGAGAKARVEIRSVKEALDRVEPAVLPGLLAACVGRRRSTPASVVERDLLAHSAGVAALARELAEIGSLRWQAQLYTSGLLHDLGWLLLLQAGELDPRTCDLSSLHEGGAMSSDRTGAADPNGLASVALTRWGLARSAVRTIGWHHAPERAIQHGGPIAASVAWLSIADELERLMARGTRFDRARITHGGDAALWRYVDFTLDELEYFWARLVRARSNALRLRPVLGGVAADALRT